MIRRSVPILLVLPVAACAQPEAPPGGPEDRVPPVVIETVPDTFATVEPGGQEFFFRFNERISERPSAGQLNNAVVISPSVGAVRVRHGRDGITVETQEGMETGRIYRVTVLPVINDMFGNRLRDPFDLVLSTGEEFVPNVVAGVVEDRITGQAVPDMHVAARFGEGADTLTHWNLTGSDGVFSMRYVPGAPFEVRAWQDRDRNLEVGETEPRSAPSRGEFARSPDTSFTILSLIEPDTTPSRLASVEVQDSVTLNFEFDDYLEPDMPGVVFEGRLVLARMTDSAAAGAAPDTAGAGERQVAAGDTLTLPPGKDTIAIRFYHRHEYELRRREVEDSIARAAEQAMVDSLAQLGELPPPAEEPPSDSLPDASPAPVGLSGQFLPAQTLIGVLAEALVRGVLYQASVSGVVNIAGTPGGGGMAAVVWELLPPDTAQVTDTAGADPDTTRADPDTTRVDPDTTRVDPDTARVDPDTARAGPDTTGVAALSFAHSANPRPALLRLLNRTRRRPLLLSVLPMC